MNAPAPLATLPFCPAVDAALDRACGRIAPTWPLDRLIAVNPFWEMRDLTPAAVSARLAALCRAHCLMPSSHYADLWKRGAIDPQWLRRASLEAGDDGSVEPLLAALRDANSAEPPHWHNVSDLLDSGRDRRHRMAWRDEITHQISQFCAAFFQQDSPLPAQPGGLYARWLEVIRRDHGIALLMGEPELPAAFRELPRDADELLGRALTELGVEDPEVVEIYAHALLLDINGWASWVAYRRWQSSLAGEADQGMRELLAIRMAWELVLWRHFSERLDPAALHRLRRLWQRELDGVRGLFERHERAQRPLRIWARAAEMHYQAQLQGKLVGPRDGDREPRPRLQAVFCIDVRSEVIRRALETQDAGIRTLGFAGFFGLPLEYHPRDTPFARPQLPGLLKPSIRVSEAVSGESGRARNRAARWQQWGRAAPASFSMVESAGWLYAFKMLKRTLFPSPEAHPVNDAAPAGPWSLTREGHELGTDEQADLAAGILDAMGLRVFAPVVLLVGHGSQSANNPHAAGLDCGACGGQTGEINVRVLAQLLNDSRVRAALAQRGRAIPDDTRFVPALHNTTTDHIHGLSGEPLPEPQQQWLTAAGELARRERSAALDPTLAEAPSQVLDRALRARSGDWSQVRPEWGLADNAAFIIAPRDRTRGIDLQGRTFLHDYAWREDPGYGVLEMILTGPLVVTHWINMQYNASVTDNLKYGSGNKVLHNVVGGHLGVFEGNGGDLRVGLPLQSVHDGERWMHEPLRLSVYIEAPREPVLDIVERHETLRQLVDNEWLFLFCLDDSGAIERLRRKGWSHRTA